MAKINVNLDSEYIGQYEIPTKEPLTIGRSEKCALQLNNQAVSGLHAAIFHQKGEVYIEDKKSTNGTIVNDKRIKKKVLNDGDSINIGKYRMKFWNQVNTNLDDYEPTIILTDAEKVALEAKKNSEIANGTSDDTVALDFKLNND